MKIQKIELTGDPIVDKVLIRVHESFKEPVEPLTDEDIKKMAEEAKAYRESHFPSISMGDGGGDA